MNSKIVKLAILILGLSSFSYSGVVSHVVAYELGKSDNKKTAEQVTYSGSQNSCRCLASKTGNGCIVQNSNNQQIIISARAFVISACSAPSNTKIKKLTWAVFPKYDYNITYMIIDWE